MSLVENIKDFAEKHKAVVGATAIGLLVIADIRSGLLKVSPINSAVAGREGYAVTQKGIGYVVFSYDKKPLDQRLSFHTNDGSITVSQFYLAHCDDGHIAPAAPHPIISSTLLPESVGC